MIRTGNWPRAIAILYLLFIVVSLIACFEDSSSNDDSSPTDNNLSGIWKGTIGKEEDLNADFVLHEGEIKGIDYENHYYTGTYTSTDGSFSATISNSEETMVITGSASDQNKIDATYENPTGETGAFTLSFNEDLYHRASSFELLSGEWTNYGVNFSIDTTGGITGTFMTCQLSGTFTIIDNDCNLYVLEADLTQCELEGQYSGLAIIDYDDDVQNDLLIAILSNDQYTLYLPAFRQ